MNDRILVWDIPVRVFHWSLAALVGAAYILSESERLRAVHAGIGYVVLGLLGFRLAWGFIGSRHARFRSFAHGPRAVWEDLRGLVIGRPRATTGHTPAGSWMILALLAMGIATGASGWMAYRDGAAEGLSEVHEAVAQAWILLAAFHVAGAVASSLLHRENLVLAMVTGRKRGPAGEALRSARPLLGGLLAILVIAGLGWAIAQRGAGQAPAATAETTMAAGHDKDDD